MAEWLEPDYFRRRRRLGRARRAANWTALALTPLLVIYAFLPGRRTAFEAGPVSSAHAMFNNDCGQCHQEWFGTGKRLLRGDERFPSVRDDDCRKCHDGAIHHENQASTPNCVECHREHRGQMVLAHVADAHCTACHANLQVDPSKGGPRKYQEKITSFNGDHPTFVERAGGLNDPGTVRFNHQKHLALRVKDFEARPAIEASLKALQARQCNTCHAPDADQRYMQPISYNKHCAVCHPLGVSVDVDTTDAKLREDVEKLRQQLVPHPASGESAETVQAILRDRFTRFFDAHAERLNVTGASQPPRPIPGHRPSQEQKKEWVDRQLQLAERRLFAADTGCAYCHTEVSEAARKDGELPDYAPPCIRERWFPHSRFSHDSHRMVECTECHGKVRELSQTSDVMMPEITTCQKCHNPQVGARSDCIECHRYHDRSKDVGPDKLSIEAVLRRMTP